MPLLEAQDLSKRYDTTPVFDHISLTLAPGELVALLGESGSGKSTLLNCLAGLDEADTGRVLLDGENLTAMNEAQRALVRRAKLGFVFQAFHVLPHLSVADNVGLPLLLLQKPDAKRVQQMLDAVGLGELGQRLPRQLSGGQLQRVAIARALVHRPLLVLADEPTGNLDARHATEVLDAVGLGDLGQRLPRQLSGGQLQRVAIARALVHRPLLVLADEPTGNLDARHATEVLDLLLAETRSQGSACLLVTHSEKAAARADRCLRLTDEGLI